MHNITPLRSYRCTLIPDTLPDDQVEAAASAGMLKAVRLKAPNAEGARKSAQHTTGRRVHEVEQLTDELTV